MSPPRWSGSEASDTMSLPLCVPSKPPRAWAQPADKIPTLEGEGEVRRGRSRGGLCSWPPALSEHLWENMCSDSRSPDRVNWLWMQHAQKKQEGSVIFYMNQTQLLEK